jgi:hypothetical protein
MNEMMVPYAIVGETVAGEAEETRKKLEKLIYSINRSTFDLAELLYSVKKNGFYKNYGFGSFAEYIEGLELKTSKAHYLVRMVDIMSEVDIPREVYEPVGIGKLREITSLDVTDNEGRAITYEKEDGSTELMSDIVRGLVAKAPDMTVSELKSYVRTLKGFVGDNDTIWVNICLNKQAFEQTVTPAFQLCKKNLGTASKDSEGMAKDYSDGKALEMISVEYLLNPANQFLAGELKSEIVEGEYVV